MKIAVTTLAICVAALLALGLVMLYSSMMTLPTGGRDLMRQAVWCAAGLACCAIVTAVDYRWLKKLAWPVYVLALGALALVFAPGIGHASHGAHRWIGFGPMTFQPSELGKLALVILLAWLGDRYQRRMRTFRQGIFVPGVLVAPILGLVILEPDHGTTVLIGAVAGAMLLLAGVRWKHILLPAFAGAAGLAIVILLDPMCMNRVRAWLHPQQHLDGAALQAHQAMIGLGSGGWFGVGLGNGMRKFGYLPEIHTDFIFANIGEELGLVATLLIVVAFAVIAVCGICIAFNARDTFGFLVASGVTLLISLQAAVNIGVVTSALPNKGLPLPFISYGGSNLLAMLTGVGLLFSIARRAPVREKISDSTADAGDNPFAARPA